MMERCVGDGIIDHEETTDESALVGGRDKREVFGLSEALAAFLLAL